MKRAFTAASSQTGVSTDRDAFRSCRLPFSNPSSPYQLPPQHSSTASLDAAWDGSGLSAARASRHGCIHAAAGLALPFPQPVANSRLVLPHPSRI